MDANMKTNNSSCSIGDGEGLEDPGSLETYDLDFLDWEEPRRIPTPSSDATDLNVLPDDLYFNGLPPLLPFEEAPFANEAHFNDSTLLGFPEDTSNPFQDDLLDFSESSEASRVSVSQNSGSDYPKFEAAAVEIPARTTTPVGGGGSASHCSDESNVSISRSRGRGRGDNPRSRKHHESASASAQRGPTERMMEISLNELSQYFHMPITQASKELKVGLTVLKKRCREFGIPRWPHRKLKSLESLIQNIQELSKNSGDRKNFMDAVRELEKQKKSMEESPGIELSERTKRLRQACFKQSYKQRRQAMAQTDMDGDDK